MCPSFNLEPYIGGVAGEYNLLIISILSQSVSVYIRFHVTIGGDRSLEMSEINHHAKLSA